MRTYKQSVLHSMFTYVQNDALENKIFKTIIIKEFSISHRFNNLKSKMDLI